MFLNAIIFLWRTKVVNKGIFQGSRRQFSHIFFFQLKLMCLLLVEDQTLE